MDARTLRPDDVVWLIGTDHTPEAAMVRFVAGTLVGLKYVRNAVSECELYATEAEAKEAAIIQFRMSIAQRYAQLQADERLLATLEGECSVFPLAAELSDMSEDDVATVLGAA